MSNVTKGEVILNSLWRFSERILAQLITTIVSVVLARLLSPDDYGTVAIIMIFVNFCNIFVSKSFNSALIQKKDVDDTDYSTVFYINIALTILIYVVLFFSAPLIASFYGISSLTGLLRVMALKIPFTAVNSIQMAYVSRNMQFKKYFYATLGGNLVSGFIGIYMAYIGMGAWALIGQYMSNTVINFVLSWVAIGWRPKFKFSFERARFLFSYGWKILVSSLIDEINIELTSFVIGKKYSAANLAYYSKGKQFPGILNTNVSDTITTIMFSVFSKEQTNKALLREHIKKTVKCIAFVMFPLFLGMAAVSKEFLLILLTEKWSAAVPFMQIFCVSCMFVPINSLNVQAVKALGESGKYLKSTLIKTVIALAVVLAAIPFGVHYVAIAGIINAAVTTFIQSAPLKKLIGYGFFDELKDLFPTLLLSVVMFVSTMLVNIFALPLWISLFAKIAVGIFVYVTLAKIFRFESFTYILNIVLSKVGRKTAK